MKMKNSLLNKIVQFKEEFSGKSKELTHLCNLVINSKNYYVVTGGLEGRGFISIRCKYCDKIKANMYSDDDDLLAINSFCEKYEIKRKERVYNLKE